MQEMKIALKAIVLKGDKILALKRSSEEEVYTGLWDIPGGRMKFGEDPYGSLKREVEEEVGIGIEIVRPYNVWSFKADSYTQVVGITFECLYKGGEVKLSKEHTEYKWLNPSEFHRLKADKNLINEIARYSKERGMVKAL